MNNDFIDTPVSRALGGAWFGERMSTDSWPFGLLLSTGAVIVITTITGAVKAEDGSVWLDVELDTNRQGYWTGILPKGTPVFVSPTRRTKASLNVAHIVAAFEMADT